MRSSHAASDVVSTRSQWHVYIDGYGSVPVRWAQVNATVIGDNTIVAAAAGKKIRVIVVELRANAALSLAVKSGNNTKIDASVMVATERLSINAHPGFWVETNEMEDLVFNQSLVGVQGIINYVEVG